nr:AMP-binding protein [Candidatus Eremiobacteraeota bacterium]
MASAHVDTFSADHLPPKSEWPDLLFTRAEFHYPQQLNCAQRLLDRHVVEGNGERRCILAPGIMWTYADLLRKANQIANVLVNEMGVQPGNRVLLRAPNTPMLAACWFAVVKAGAVAVSTMPLYRAGELRYMIEKAQIRHALCDHRLAEELIAASDSTAGFQTIYFGDQSDAQAPHSAE